MGVLEILFIIIIIIIIISYDHSLVLCRFMPCPYNYCHDLTLSFSSRGSSAVCARELQKMDWKMTTQSGYSQKQRMLSFSLQYSLTLLPCFNTLIAQGMFCSAKYTHHTFIPVKFKFQQQQIDILYQ